MRREQVTNTFSLLRKMGEEDSVSLVSVGVGSFQPRSVRFGLSGASDSFFGGSATLASLCFRFFPIFPFSSTRAKLSCLIRLHSCASMFPLVLNWAFWPAIQLGRSCPPHNMAQNSFFFVFKNNFLLLKTQNYSPNTFDNFLI